MCDIINMTLEELSTLGEEIRKEINRRDPRFRGPGMEPHKGYDAVKSVLTHVEAIRFSTLIARNILNAEEFEEMASLYKKSGAVLSVKPEMSFDQYLENAKKFIIG